MDSNIVYLSKLDPSLNFLLNENENENYHITNHIKSKKLNKLQKLILFSNNIIVKEFLIKNIYNFKKEDFLYKNEKNWTALMMAAANTNSYSNNEIVKLLLEYNTDTNAVDVFGRNSLLLSCYNSSFKTIKLLIENGYDINIKDIYGYTALTIICVYSNIKNKYKTIKFLLKNGSDPNIKTTFGWSCLFLLLNKNDNIDLKILKILLKYNADPNIIIDNIPLFYILFNRINIDSIKLLLKYGANPNILTQNGYNLTQYCRFDLELLVLLIKYGAEYTLDIFDNIKTMKTFLELNIKIPKLIDIYNLPQFNHKNLSILIDYDIELFPIKNLKKF